jgi:hypothetical protein
LRHETTGCGEAQDNISLIRTENLQNRWIQHAENIQIDMTISRMYLSLAKDIDHSQNEQDPTIKYTHYFVLSNH